MKITISTGFSRFDTKWKTEHLSVDELCYKLSTPIRTEETAAEYAAMAKDKKGDIKDHGGFVGGKLRGNRRSAATVESRSLITLDLDDCPQSFIDELPRLLPYDCFVYTTHSHTPEAPRYRVLVFLTRDISADEYNAIAHYLAHDIGAEHVDPCSFRVAQLMYWPTVPKDGEFISRRLQNSPLNPDIFLTSHPNWRDLSDLPRSERETVAMGVRTVEDPHKKRGIVGVFCRAYPFIDDAITKYLPHVYQPSVNHEGRYDYIPGSASAGAAIIDGKWLYSHHATDPAGGHMQNAFDLVRIHLYGHLDKEYNGPVEASPSFAAMEKRALQDPVVIALSRSERQESLSEDFGNPEKQKNWMENLIYNEKGKLVSDIVNGVLILENDPILKGIVFNEFADNLELQPDIPWHHKKFWREADDAHLDYYISSHYGPLSPRCTQSAVDKVADDRSYHPILDFLDALPEWDGIPRLDTLLIDHFGAEDTQYTRAVTRKALVAAVRRVLQPGCKFDYILTLVGPQGVGKSTLIRTLSGDEYFSDTLKFSDARDKTAAENIQGNWIIEIGEMAGMKKAEIENVKAFVSRQNDKYRAAYGHRPTPHPRQCIFIGTGNQEEGFLRDLTGNRRFWPVVTPVRTEKQQDILKPDYIAQVWAEAKVREEEGEPIYLSSDLEHEAELHQLAAMERDDREGIVRSYLEKPLPANWDEMGIYQRRTFLEGDDPTMPKGTVKRNTVSKMEIWCECFGRKKEDMQPKDSYAIAAIMVHLPEWKKDGTQASKLYGRQRVYRLEQ